MWLAGAMNRPSLALVPALAALLIAGCGGGSGSSDADQIAKVVKSTAGITDASLCDSLFTDQGIQETYREDTPEAARKDCQDNVKDKSPVTPDDVTVSDIEITGDTATATASAKGQDTKGYFRLRKIGSDWKIDGVSETPGGTTTTETTPAPTTSTPDVTTTETTPAATATDTTATTAPDDTSGGSSGAGPDVAQVEGSVLAWARAGREGSKYAFCGLESPGLLERQTGKTGKAAVVACVRGFHRVTSFPTPESIVFSDPQIDGDRAEVSIKAPGKGNTTRLKLVRAARFWKIDDVAK